MKERPILFSAALVNAILAGTKTVTRRPVKLHDDEALRFDPCEPIERRYLAVRDDDETEHRNVRALGAPYGAPGDRLWVRETLRRVDSGKRGERWVYGADDATVTLPREDPRVPAMISWAHHKEGDTCTSIHMPRWASRILLEVTDVRVERLQEITEEDVYAEGVEVPVTDEGCPPGKVQPLHRLTGKHPTFGYAAPGAPGADVVRAHFASAWESIYGAGSWDANGFVWVVRFTRIEVP